MKANNYPSVRQDTDLNGVEWTGTAIQSIRELSERGKPKSIEELQERFDDFFDFCQAKNLRPGVELMACALNIDRRTFWTWCEGARGKEWGDVCRNAKQLLIGFMEQAGLSAHLNPATFIFVMKNLASWKDAISFDEAPPLRDSEIRGEVEYPVLPVLIPNPNDKA